MVDDDSSDVWLVLTNTKVKTAMDSWFMESKATRFMRRRFMDTLNSVYKMNQDYYHMTEYSKQSDLR